MHMLCQFFKNTGGYYNDPKEKPLVMGCVVGFSIETTKAMRRNPQLWINTLGAWDGLRSSTHQPERQPKSSTAC